MIICLSSIDRLRKISNQYKHGFFFKKKRNTLRNKVIEILENRLQRNIMNNFPFVFSFINIYDQGQF